MPPKALFYAAAKHKRLDRLRSAADECGDVPNQRQHVRENLKDAAKAAQADE